MWRVPVTTVTVEQQETYSECVSVALVIQCAERMRHIMLPHIACRLHIILYNC